VSCETEERSLGAEARQLGVQARHLTGEELALFCRVLQSREGFSTPLSSEAGTTYKGLKTRALLPRPADTGGG